MSFDVDRADLRRMANSEAPQWVKDMAQSMLDWGNELSRSFCAAFVPRALPLLPPQLPPGNGQSNLPCDFCAAMEHRRWCITQTPTRGYTLATLTTWPFWPYGLYSPTATEVTSGD